MEWMLRHTFFVNSMPIVSGPQVGNILDPQVTRDCGGPEAKIQEK